MWFEDVYKLQMQNEKTNETELMILELEKKYQVDFNNLEKPLTKNVFTDDGASHFYDRTTDTVYSWNYLSCGKYWYIVKDNKKFKHIFGWN